MDVSVLPLVGGALILGYIVVFGVVRVARFEREEPDHVYGTVQLGGFGRPAIHLVRYDGHAPPAGLVLGRYSDGTQPIRWWQQAGKHLWIPLTADELAELARLLEKTVAQAEAGERGSVGEIWIRDWDPSAGRRLRCISLPGMKRPVRLLHGQGPPIVSQPLQQTPMSLTTDDALMLARLALTARLDFLTDTPE